VVSGLVMGLFSGANACGQLVFLPLIVHLAHSPGWRAAALAVALLAVLIFPFWLLWFADRPQDLGLRPYGENPEHPQPGPVPSAVPAWKLAVVVLREAARRRAFWILAFTFFVCGWFTNGLVQTHFIEDAVWRPCPWGRGWNTGSGPFCRGQVEQFEPKPLPSAREW
jgi:MFS family permease